MNKNAVLLAILSGSATMDLVLRLTFDIVFWIAVVVFIFSAIWLYKSR